MMCQFTIQHLDIMGSLYQLRVQSLIIIIRYGFGVGATGVPAYRSSTNYKGEPIIYFNVSDTKKRVKQEDTDDHKMDEDFSSEITRR